MQEAESSRKEKLEKKSMLDEVADALTALKPGEWQEHCRKSDDQEDKALGRFKPEDG